jgi:hypothetical protein
LPSTAGGEFGAPLSGSTPLILAYTFNSKDEHLTISARGTIFLLPDSGAPTSPLGRTQERTLLIGSYSEGYTPLEEGIIDSGGSVPTSDHSSRLPNLAGVIGAFIPKSRCDTPGFEPRDSDVVPGGLGINSTELFLIGEGPFVFKSPGPGCLFIGVNDAFNSNNSGSFIVTTSNATEGIVEPVMIHPAVEIVTASIDGALY